MGAREDEGTNRVTHAGSTVRVELATRIALRDVHLGEVADTSDLDVGRGLGEVDTLQRAVGDEASTTARLEAPRDDLGLHVAHLTDRRRRVEAEVLLLRRPSEQIHSNVSCDDNNRASLTFRSLIQMFWQLALWLEPVPH